MDGKEQLVNRLINTWDGDAEELLALVQLINCIRQRAIESAIVAERKRCAQVAMDYAAGIPRNAPFATGSGERHVAAVIAERILAAD